MISNMVGSKKKIDKRKRKGQKDAEQKQRIRNYKKKQQENNKKKNSTMSKRIRWSESFSFQVAGNQ